MVKAMYGCEPNRDEMEKPSTGKDRLKHIRFNAGGPGKMYVPGNATSVRAASESQPSLCTQPELPKESEES